MSCCHLYSSLSGKLLTVESICTNYTTVYRDDGNLNVDNSYHCLDLQGKWDFWFIRLFYLKNVAPIPDLCVGKLLSFVIPLRSDSLVSKKMQLDCARGKKQVWRPYVRT